MKTKEKNKLYWDILTNKFNLNLEKSFYELNDEELSTLFNLSELFNIRERYGVSPARVLWHRARKGRPF